MISTCSTVIRIALLCVLLGSCAKNEEPEPIVSVDENIFINELYASGIDWIELYNANQEAKDISGYFIYDDPINKYTIPSGTLIPAMGFLVLFCDDQGTGLHTNFKLTENGEIIYLQNKSMEVIDRVEFPALSDGQSYGRYPDGSSTFATSGNSSQGFANEGSQAPAISKVSREPIVPELSTPVIIMADVVSIDAISLVKLFYRFDSETYTEVIMVKGETSYSGIIPAQNKTGKIEYYIESQNTLSKTSRDPYDAPSNVHHYLLNTDILPTLYINEFMTANTSCCPDKDSGVDEFDDWIEIYNASSVVVDVGGMYISDDKNKPFTYQIPNTDPASTTLQPGGFLLLWADGSPDQGIDHLDFRLGNGGEDIGLFYIDGRTIDVVTFGAQNENVSYGRTTDGALAWKVFTLPTPEKSNN
ncbi:MAG: lamin tail domain-containing protein [Bacteroidota bacterium]